MQITKENMKENEIYFSVVCGKIHKVLIISIPILPRKLRIGESFGYYYVFINNDSWFSQNILHSFFDDNNNDFNKIFDNEKEAFNFINDEMYQIKLSEWNAQCEAWDEYDKSDEEDYMESFDLSYDEEWEV